MPDNIGDYVLYQSADMYTRSYADLFKKNDKIIIELTTQEVFQGDFLEAGKNRIDLINIEQLDIPNRHYGFYTFYRNEISQIRHLKNAESNSAINQDLHYIEDETCIKLNKEEYYRLKDMRKKYVFIETMSMSDSKYIEAIEVLKSAEQIGIAAPGIIKRNPCIPLLVFSTYYQVFIFDSSVLSTTVFDTHMKEIFESENICKIIHKGAPLSDILNRFHSILPKNVYDTEMVDLFIQRNQNKSAIKLRNIGECLEAYLNFPPILNDAIKVKPEKWSKRPLKESKMVYASQLSIYLITLKETFCDIILKDFNLMMDNFCDYYANIQSYYQFSENFYLEKLTPELRDLITDFPFLSLTSTNSEHSK